MRNNAPFKDFDLPTKHLEPGNHFVPPKARDEQEIARRHSLPHGTILAEHQAQGLGMASTILKLIERPEDIAFSSRVLAASGLNTAWYAFARGAEAEVMRRRLKLPYLAASTPGLRKTSADLVYESAHMFGEAMVYAGTVVNAMQEHHPRLGEYKRAVGRISGRAALTLACVELGDQLRVQDISGSDIQTLVRQRGLRALQDSRTLDEQIGVPPSLAQLADPDSHLSVFWRRESPNGALKAYETAAELRLAA